MQQSGLVGSIKCGDDGCFFKKIILVSTGFALLPFSAIAFVALRLNLNHPRRARFKGASGEPLSTQFLVSNYLG